ncbi:hypothetical protein QMZ05_24600 [Bradyrhizobium sp. INPA03-11B]|uniref:hypothetical protein n=1 Tax=Bradyrhizobium sp. INPA03-11B TaxID=418598 RepID=UPI00338F3DC6
MSSLDYDPGLDPRAADTLRSAMLNAGYQPKPQAASSDFDPQSSQPPSSDFDPKEFAAYKTAANLQWPGKPVRNAEQWPGQPVESWPGQKVASNEPMSWSDVGLSALQNAPGSAVQFGHDIAQPFLHPIDTATNIKNLGHGILQKVGIMSGSEDEKYADAVGRFYADRYGGIENVKRAIANDPVGVLGDLSVLLSGGETALARVPGVVGKLGEVAGAAGRMVDPLRAAAGAGKVAGRAGAEALGLTTGAGPEAIKIAARSGYEGGEAARAFRENMTRAAPMEDVVNDARNAVSQMRRERGDAYRTAMQGIGADKTILSWNDVDTALGDMDRVATFKGQSLSPSTEAMRDKITGVIDDWKNLRASEFHTPEGFDALKKKVGDLRDAAQRGTPERLVADQAYSAIRKTIVDQAPEYSKAMKGYEQASALIKEMETTLSAKPNAPVDRTLRKLQSVLRDNVNTAYGRRAELANYLVNAGAPRLMEKLAGQALSSWAPRGLNRMLAAGAMESVPMALGLGTAGAHGAAFAGLGALPTMSPRLMGEASYGAGRAARMATPLSVLPRPARQLGRLPSSQEFNPDDFAAWKRQAAGQ